MKTEPKQTLKPMPIIVARATFMERVTEAVNHSGLPAFVMRDVVKELLQVLEQLSEQQYQEELRRYNETTGGQVGTEAKQATPSQNDPKEAQDERKEE